MPFYSAARENYAPTTTNADIGLTAVSPVIARLTEAMVSGVATSSAVNRQGIVRHTALGTTPSAIVVGKQNPQSGTAIVTPASTFSTPPTFSAVTNIQLGLNAFGGIIRWVAAPGEEFYLVSVGATANQEASLTAKNGATAGNQSAHLVWEEL